MVFNVSTSERNYVTTKIVIDFYLALSKMVCHTLTQDQDFFRCALCASRTGIMVFMNHRIKSIAQVLGSYGGKARAKRLSKEKKREIALLGAQSRVISLSAAKRIENNFGYVMAMHQLHKIPRVRRLKTCRHPLPCIVSSHHE